MAIKLIHGLPKNLTESNNNVDVSVQSIKNAIMAGVVAANNLHGVVDRTVLESFGYTIPNVFDITKDINFIQEMWAENEYNPLLIIHQLRESGDVEGVKQIQLAYSQFAEVVNSYCTPEMAKQNQDLIKNICEVLKIAIK